MRTPVVLLGKTVLTVVAGFVVGAIGTIMHRSLQPWGLVLSLALVLAAATTVRAFGGLVAWIGFVVALGATELVLSQKGPGGDVLLPSGQTIGLVWIGGSIVLAVVAMLLPRGWFSAEPLPPRPGTPVPTADVAGEPDVPL
ncbi:hypothetical protein ACPPVS_03430 [Cellulomonas sp. McL0617]|uniref:hypothetical protein n=1 Tax=Cellulomonas sp. McL0617 TaxID=3415675 RepID=UPI003CF96127